MVQELRMIREVLLVLQDQGHQEDQKYQAVHMVRQILVCLKHPFLPSIL